MGKPIIYVFHAVDEGINRVVVIGRDRDLQLGVFRITVVVYVVFADNSSKRKHI